ncbi:CBS domain-containing protein, partial [uncultured Meiothermus sp.]|uniref:CBS domain-containing protein n=1 Tax=uncultured Meiothermus sp. TaxID=157471 RepID=UPI00345461B0
MPTASWTVETSAPGLGEYLACEVIAMLVKDCMTPNPDVVTPDITVPEAAQIMKKGGFRRLPVVKEGRVIGIVTD